jgi:hypothetical protein
MSDLHSNTVKEKPAETAFIEVSGPIYLTLLEAKKALGFETIGDLVRDMLTASKTIEWLEFPDLLSVCDRH